MERFIEFISEIRFETPDEFYKKRKYIKEKYMSLNEEVKEVYKWYFYFQLCLLKNPLKELFWSYLNEEESILLNSNLICEYEIFCSKRRKQKIVESQIDKKE